MLHSFRGLSQAGLLGLNARNLDCIARHNRRSLYPQVDDKLITKKLAQAAGVAVPPLYAVVEIQHQAQELHNLLSSRRDFVIKPCRGSGGEGVLVITDRLKDSYRTANGELFNREELNYHISRILSGVYSLGSHPDKALCEYRVKHSSVFDNITYLGVPDVRIIVLLGVPIMSMVRLPTRVSGGRANLHQGAIGAGVDIRTGLTLTAVWRNRIISEHPDTGTPIKGLQLPHWENLLALAASCCELTGLGYIGVDIVLDQDMGPLLLELNARPGLNIQLANRAGLSPRIKAVERHRPDLRSLEERVAFAREQFAAL
jgi:alpha-L-glutamate ligase-like protein